MQLTDPQRFTLVSVIIVATVMIATGLAASTFYRRAMIQRETDVMQDMVNIIAHEQEAESSLSASDLTNYTDNAARTHLEHSFIALTRLPGFSRIKVFGPNRKIVWSDAAELIGTSQTHNPEAVARALTENSPSAFNPALSGPDVDNLIEFYIPFQLGVPRASPPPASYPSIGPPVPLMPRSNGASCCYGRFPGSAGFSCMLRCIVYFDRFIRADTKSAQNLQCSAPSMSA